MAKELQFGVYVDADVKGKVWIKTFSTTINKDKTKTVVVELRKSAPMSDAALEIITLGIEMAAKSGNLTGNIWEEDENGQRV